MFIASNLKQMKVADGKLRSVLRTHKSYDFSSSLNMGLSHEKSVRDLTGEVYLVLDSCSVMEAKKRKRAYHA